MSPLIKNLLFALVLAVIVWVGYMVFMRESDDIVTGTTMNEATRDSSEFLIRLRQLESIELRGDILEDARFKSLVNYTQDVLDEPVGRKNPFLPIDSTE